MFRKVKFILILQHDSKKDNLELRHQRTCDVVFDLVQSQNVRCDIKTKNYVYKMIETLLPRSLENLGKNEHLSMMELQYFKLFRWGQRDIVRKGWIILS